MHIKLYEVGGCVRDEILGVKSKDIDYTVVIEGLGTSDAEIGFSVMRDYLFANDFEIFLETAPNYTIRARFPNNSQHKGLTADFVLARKEIGYTPGTRQPILELGSLFDDLYRRDFTLNALAKDLDTGRVIDYFGGIEHLNKRLLTTPNPDTLKTMFDDPLRLIRAMRFSITKSFQIDPEINKILLNFDYDNLMGVVSKERIREELMKCFHYNTIDTLNRLHLFPRLRDYIFNDGTLWLKPTMEQ